MSIATFAQRGAYTGAVINAGLGGVVGLVSSPSICKILGAAYFEGSIAEYFKRDFLSEYVLSTKDPRFDTFWKCSAIVYPVQVVAGALQGAIIGGILGTIYGVYSRMMHRV